MLLAVVATLPGWLPKRVYVPAGTYTRLGSHPGSVAITDRSNRHPS